MWRHVLAPAGKHVHHCVTRVQQRARGEQAVETCAGMCSHLPEARPPLRDPDGEGGVCADRARSQ